MAQEIYNQHQKEKIDKYKYFVEFFRTNVNDPDGDLYKKIKEAATRGERSLSVSIEQLPYGLKSALKKIEETEQGYCGLNAYLFDNQVKDDFKLIIDEICINSLVIEW